MGQRLNAKTASIALRGIKHLCRIALCTGKERASKEFFVNRYLSEKRVVARSVLRDAQAVFDNSDVGSRGNVLFVGRARIKMERVIGNVLGGRVEVVTGRCVKAEHVGEKLEIVFVPDVFRGLIFGVGKDASFGITADEVGIDASVMPGEQVLCAFSVLILRMIKGSRDKRVNVFLPQPCAVEEDAV